MPWSAGLSGASCPVPQISVLSLGRIGAQARRGRGSNTSRIAPWLERGLRPDTAQPVGFGPCVALAHWPEGGKTASLDPLWPVADHPRMDSNESTDIWGQDAGGEGSLSPRRHPRYSRPGLICKHARRRVWNCKSTAGPSRPRLIRPCPFCGCFSVLELTGTKFGCGVAACGACTVRVEASPSRSCVTPVSSVAWARRFQTIRGAGRARVSRIPCRPPGSPSRCPSVAIARAAC